MRTDSFTEDRINATATTKKVVAVATSDIDTAPEPVEIPARPSRSKSPEIWLDYIIPLTSGPRKLTAPWLPKAVANIAAHAHAQSTYEVMRRRSNEAPIDCVISLDEALAIDAQVVPKIVAAGLDPYRPEDAPIFGDLVGGSEPVVSHPGRRLKNWDVFASSSRAERNAWAAWLIAFIQCHPKGKFARFMVLTHGTRVSLGDLAARLVALRKAVHTIATKAMKKFRVEVVFTSIECPVRVEPGGSVSCHPHTNMITIPHQVMDDVTLAKYLAWLNKVAGGLVHDAGLLGKIEKITTNANGSPKVIKGSGDMAQAIKYVVKYLVKCEDILALGGPALRQYIHIFENRKRYEAYGDFRHFRRVAKACGIAFRGVAKRIVAVHADQRPKCERAANDDGTNIILRLGIGRSDDDDGRLVGTARLLDYIATPDPHSPAAARLALAQEWTSGAYGFALWLTAFDAGNRMSPWRWLKLIPAQRERLARPLLYCPHQHRKSSRPRSASPATGPEI